MDFPIPMDPRPPLENDRTYSFEFAVSWTYPIRISRGAH